MRCRVLTATLKVWKNTLIHDSFCRPLAGSQMLDAGPAKEREATLTILMSERACGSRLPRYEVYPVRAGELCLT